jgi:hypothetical protein
MPPPPPPGFRPVGPMQLRVASACCVIPRLTGIGVPISACGYSRSPPAASVLAFVPLGCRPPCSPMCSHVLPPCRRSVLFWDILTPGLPLLLPFVLLRWLPAGAQAHCSRNISVWRLAYGPSSVVLLAACCARCCVCTCSAPRPANAPTYIFSPRALSLCVICRRLPLPYCCALILLSPSHLVGTLSQASSYNMHSLSASHSSTPCLTASLRAVLPSCP